MSEKYEFIDAEYAALAGDAACAPTVVQMCEWLEVSRSGFYEWRSRPQSATAKRRELLKIKIKALFEFNNEEYGYRRCTPPLARGGERCGPELVRAADARAGPGALPAEAVAALADRAGRPAGPIPDLVSRDFTAEKPGAENGR